jgi:tetratricopeptide (TPR) repeat protein
VDDWSLEATIGKTDAALAEDPLDVEAYFVRGVAQLACGDAAGAVVSLRRALYLDPLFGLAAFKLARAQDALGEPEAARRTYARALRLLAAEDERSRAVADNVSLHDVARACSTRLAALAQPRS